MTGRPSSFTPDTGDAICQRLVDGESLRSICCDEGMPAQSTVCRWLASGEGEEAPADLAAFRKQYARARELQADTLFDEILDIADDGSNDWMERKREDGSTDEVLNHEHVQRSKLRIDSRKWMAGKLAPKRYGDKLQHVGGGEDDAPIRTETRLDVSRLSIEQQRALASIKLEDEV